MLCLHSYILMPCDPLNRVIGLCYIGVVDIWLALIECAGSNYIDQR